MGYKVAVITEVPAGGPAPTADYGTQVHASLEKAGHTIIPLACDEDLVPALRAERPDACWVALAGRVGMDGGVQALLEFLGIPYVGPSAAFRRLAADKAALFDRLAEARARGELDASMPRTFCLTRTAVEGLGASQALDLVNERIPGGYPVCVKPAHGGLGAAARRVDDAEGLAAALHNVLVCDDAALVQEWVEGVEVAVCILGDADDLQVLPPIEVVPNPDGTAGHKIPVRPASLHEDRSEAEAIRSEIERTAVDAYLACGCRDFGCVELVWDGARARVIGLGGPAPLFEAAEAAGIPAPDLADTLVSLAVERG